MYILLQSTTYGNYIEAVETGTVSTFSAQNTRALHSYFTMQSIHMFCVLVNHHCSKFMALTKQGVYCTYKVFFSINFQQHPIKKFEDDSQKQQQQFYLTAYSLIRLCQTATILKLKKNCKTVTLIYLTFKNQQSKADIDGEEGVGAHLRLLIISKKRTLHNESGICYLRVCL